MIELTAGDGHKFSAYRADPDGTPKGAVVVVQDFFGIDTHIRKIADEFAAKGYLAIAPSLFDSVKTEVALGHDEGGLAEGGAYPAGRHRARDRRHSADGRCRQDRRQGDDRRYGWGGYLAYVSGNASTA
jgi:carboxymethylenebutenolidase